LSVPSRKLHRQQDISKAEFLASFLSLKTAGDDHARVIVPLLTSYYFLRFFPRSWIQHFLDRICEWILEFALECKCLRKGFVSVHRLGTIWAPPVFAE
jgi:hypothetical protein